jgi:hypothetical protein
MVGLSKIVTVLVTVMAVLCMAGIAGPALAQSYGGKGIPQTANVGANANMGMGKSIPQAANVGMGKSIPQAANVGMGKGMPQTANVGANANMGLGKGMSKGEGYGGYGGYGMDMGTYGAYGLGYPGSFSSCGWY